MTEDRLVELYRRYGKVIFGRCLKLLNDRAAAEDATQETFVRVYRHLSQAPSDEAALRWVYRIATNYCLNEIRNRNVRATPTEKLPERPGVSPDEVLADRDAVMRLLRFEPARLRAVALLLYVDGLEQHEVAQILGLSRRTVVNRLAEFVKRARKLLAGRAVP